MPNKDKSPFITTGERVGNYLALGFVLSLAVHAAFTPFLHWQHREESQTVEKVTVTKQIHIKPPTPPPPTPTPPPPKKTPPPQVKPQTHPQPKLKVQPPKLTTNNTSSTQTQAKYVPPAQGSERGNPNGVGTAPPAPPAPTLPPGTPKPACATPYQDATATNPMSPDYPDSAREEGLGAVVVNVIVTLSATGQPLSATLQNSSGNLAIDNAAKQAALQSQYAPKIVNCQPVQGQYIFKVTFDPNG
jgi:protein TonB